jgi:hypothetical protein
MSDAAAGPGDNDEVLVTEALTIEEIVNQKFEHAAANGCVLEVDLPYRQDYCCGLCRSL